MITVLNPQRSAFVVAQALMRDRDIYVPGDAARQLLEANLAAEFTPVPQDSARLWCSAGSVAFDIASVGRT